MVPESSSDVHLQICFSSSKGQFENQMYTSLGLLCTTLAAKPGVLDYQNTLVVLLTQISLKE